MSHSLFLFKLGTSRFLLFIVTGLTEYNCLLHFWFWHDVTFCSCYRYCYVFGIIIVIVTIIVIVIVLTLHNLYLLSLFPFLAD